MKYPFMMTLFRSPLDLDKVCEVLSTHLFMGVPFVVGDVREEVPSRVLPLPVLGMYVVVSGEGGDEPYELWVEPSFDLSWPVEPRDQQRVKFDEYLGTLLGRIEQIEPIAHG